MNWNDMISYAFLFSCFTSVLGNVSSVIFHYVVVGRTLTRTPAQEQAESAPVEPAVAEEAATAEETEDTVSEEAPKQDVHSTAGVTEAGRALNDPRVAPKPVTETAVSTELGELFATPEAPPVKVVQQDVSRASNDPRGPRAA